MRHGKHKHPLVPTQEHRKALLSNLAAALFTHGRIQTTLAKAKALRPFSEKVITLAKKAAATPAKAVAFKRLALSYVRDEDAITTLFKDRAGEFSKRTGGYTRIYKLGTRVNDAAEMALIELIPASDEGRKPRSKRTAAKAAAPVATEASASAATDAQADKPAAKKKSTKKE
jgi:large subunit ribosomal protein L17